MAKSPSANRQPVAPSVVIETIALLLRHSPARDLAGDEALSSVLKMRFRDMLRGTQLGLEPLWQLLADQPGFDFDVACPAFAALKARENLLRLEVILPSAMAELDRAALEKFALEVHVPTAELKAVLNASDSKGDEAPRPRARATSMYTVDPAGESLSSAATSAVGWKSNPLIGIAAAVLGVAALVVAGLALKSALWTTPQFKAVGEQFSGDIPVAAAQRLGSEVGATLHDPGWLELPVDTRVEHMTTAMTALGDDIQVFYLKDGTGTVRAIAQRHSGSIKFSFP